MGKKRFTQENIFGGFAIVEIESDKRGVCSGRLKEKGLKTEEYF